MRKCTKLPLAEKALERAKHQLIRRLSAEMGYLLRTSNGWDVFGQRNEFCRPLATVEDTLVAALRTKGLLVPRPGGGLIFSPAAAGATTDFRLAHMLTETPSAAGPIFNKSESPLAWLRSRRDSKGRPLIGDEQFTAGEKLRVDYERAQMQARTTSSWQLPIDARSAADRSGNYMAALTDNALAARECVNRALSAVGPELGGVLLEVCCLAAGIEQAERRLELPARSGKAVLSLALTALARHYGLLTGARGHRSALLHWAMGDYRPAIAASESS